MPGDLHEKGHRIDPCDPLTLTLTFNLTTLPLLLQTPNPPP